MSKNQKKKLREKKNKIIKQIKDKIDAKQEFSENETNDLANKWMEIADIDGNGTIDLNEFEELTSKLDEKLSK